MSNSFSRTLTARRIGISAILIGVLGLPLIPGGPQMNDAGVAWGADTLVISRGRLHRDAPETGEAGAETLIIGRDAGADLDISIKDGRRITIDREDYDGDMVLMGDDIFVEEDEVVEGSVVAIGGNVTVHGKVLEDVVAVGGSITLGDSAVVVGDAVSVGGGVDKEPGARLGGKAVNVGVSVPLPFLKAPKSKPQGAFQNFARWLVFYLVIFAGAALCIYLARDRISYASSYLEKEPFPSFLLGVLSPAMALVAFVLLCITLIGIPVALALIFLYPVFLFLGWIVTGQRIGSSVRGEQLVTVRTVFTGLLVISGLHILGIFLKLIGAGGVPIALVQVAGFTLSFTSALVGLGAILGTRFRRRPEAPSPMAYPPYGPPGVPMAPVSGPVGAAPTPYAPSPAGGFAPPPPDAPRQG